MLRKSRKSLLLLVGLMALMVLTVAVVSAAGFTHGPVINVDGEKYYMAGAPVGSDGATDIPGHYWRQAGPNQVVGKHYNTGPWGASQWWSSNAPDGELLYIVHGIIDEWTEANAKAYAARGYVHYHELIAVDGGAQHLTKVIWLRHTARTSFTFEGGPHPEHPARWVSPGVDYKFLPNGMMPYVPAS
jgi:hypothetical protein